MQLQRALAELPQVEDAGVVMATPANLELLQQNSLLPGQAQAGPDDLLIVVRTGSKAEAQAALGQVDALLARRPTAVDQSYRPRSLAGALKLLPEAGWVLISVPGRYAAGVAREALDLKRHVFLYSDNVSLEDEAALKHAAREAGLLVMGPDCGTAMLERHWFRLRQPRAPRRHRTGGGLRHRAAGSDHAHPPARPGHLAGDWDRWARPEGGDRGDHHPAGPGPVGPGPGHPGHRPDFQTAGCPGHTAGVGPGPPIPQAGGGAVHGVCAAGKPDRQPALCFFSGASGRTGGRTGGRRLRRWGAGHGRLGGQIGDPPKEGRRRAERRFQGVSQRPALLARACSPGARWPARRCAGCRRCSDRCSPTWADRRPSVGRPARDISSWIWGRTSSPWVVCTRCSTTICG